MRGVRLNTAANRGRFLEELVEYANQQYRAKGLAVIHKVPTAWLPLRDRTGMIRSAKVEEKAAVDFLGVVNGKAIAFDAKQTSEKRIRWDRVEEHQAAFLESWKIVGGQPYILVGFVAEQPARYFMIPWAWWSDGMNGYYDGYRASKGRGASISVAELAEYGEQLGYKWEVFPTPYSALDYLTAVGGEPDGS